MSVPVEEPLTANGGNGAVLGDKPLTVPKPTNVTFVSAEPIRQRVREDAGRLGFPDHIEEIEEAEAKLARLQVLAGGPPPRDSNRFLSDRLVDEHLAALRSRAAKEEAELDSASRELDAAEMQLAATPAPSAWWSFAWRVAGAGLVALVSIVATALLLAPTVSDLVYGAIADDIFGRSAKHAFLCSLLVGACLAAMVVLLQYGAVVFTDDRVGLSKTLFLLADVALAAAVGGLRLYDSFSFAALFWSVLELGGLLAQTAMFFALATYLRKNGDKHAVYAPARLTVQALTRRCRRIEASLARIRSILTAQLEAVAERDHAVHQVAVAADLAEQEARTTYRIESGHQMTAAATTVAEDQAAGHLGADLAHHWQQPKPARHRGAERSR